MSHLAQVHRVPVSEFAHIDRLASPPQNPTDIALHATERMYTMGSGAGNLDTTLEFLQGWLRRNAPAHRTDVRFLSGDAGQFMSAGTDSADEAMTTLLKEDTNEHDTELVQAFHRRTLRLSMIVAGTDPDTENPFFHILEPILAP